MSTDLATDIYSYYEARDLKWPTSEEAILWVITELGEAIEPLMARKGNWVRNNKEGQEFTAEWFGTELGDVVMMVMVAGMQAGVDPIRHLRQKMARKLGEMNEPEDENLDQG